MKLSSEIIAIYLGKKLSHETVPLSAVFIFEAVCSVVHPFERVVELWDTLKLNLVYRLYEHTIFLREMRKAGCLMMLATSKLHISLLPRL